MNTTNKNKTNKPLAVEEASSQPTPINIQKRVKTRQSAVRAASRPNPQQVARKHLVAQQASSPQEWRLLALPAMVAALLGTSVGAQASITVNTPSPQAQGSTTTGTPGAHGENADCGIDLHPPHSAGDGTAPAGENISLGISDISSPTYNSGAIYYSVGGAGGDGGFGCSLYPGTGGGTGSAGGDILLSSQANLTITGTGLMAESTGGRGGNGGGTSEQGGSPGNGGAGGNGGAADLVNASGTSIIITGSDPSASSTVNSPAMYGLSLGGGSGNGASSSSCCISSEPGSGGAGGAGGEVSLSNSGVISTTGAAYGMVGMSVGAYGGNNGTVSSLFPAPNSDPGYGGAGGSVNAYNGGTISTNGLYQTGVMLLSIGGGGGNAGQNNDLSLVQLGANGGPGGNGGNIGVTNDLGASISTLAAASMGIEALSVGGGGGAGAVASGGLIGGGGSGGGGGNGGNLDIINLGGIYTGGGAGATAPDSASVSSVSGFAPAILAASVGGGGGAGGQAITTTTSFSMAIGGAGGDGGSAGAVHVDQTGILSTTEPMSPGVIAASIGGGGGHGGGAVALSGALINPVTISTAIGGTGGSGGSGGVVGINCGSANSLSFSTSACTGVTAVGAANASSAINTLGTDSPGLFGMSLGGGGGAGGSTIAISVDASNGGGSAFSSSVGGSGSNGGHGVDTYVGANGFPINTSGEQSAGIEALSVGGGGGHGGISVSGVVSESYNASTAVGGKGGTGGAGGSVLAENLGSTINTWGDIADGITAMSIGGGGGHGGLAAGEAVSGVMAFSTTVGGVGGTGNNGGQVEVFNDNATSAIVGGYMANITTHGDNAQAIQALSIGGGGGRGGWSAGSALSIGPASSFKVGGNGGTGGNSGLVSVNNIGTLQVIGRGGAGILGLSVAGGGGNGGSSANAGMSLTADFNSTVGGTGGGGGTSGEVYIGNGGTIYTGYDAVLNPATDWARGTQGILAMSIGGGGGRGGLAVAGSVSGDFNLNDQVGGGSGAGGNSSDVLVNNTNSAASINTFGDFSNAITASSIGGRGGMGGTAIGGAASVGSAYNVTLGSAGGNGGIGNSATVNNTGKIATYGFRSMGITAQSMGGHGGMGGMAIGSTVAADLTTAGVPSSTITLGGTGGAGGIGGSATITHGTTASASVSTIGPFSTGLLAQSIGGDGGIGGIGIGAAVSPFSVNATLGGSGGSGALGGAATVNTTTGSVTTTGSESDGVMAQSIGGNGGLSGLSLALAQANNAATYGMSLGNAAGSGGTGGTATASISNSPIVTSGNLSDGVAVQSVGGGGGRATLDLNLSVANLATPDSNGNATLGTTAGGGGNGGVANLTQTGAVTTSGAQSLALSAASIGGGGGSAGQHYLNISSGSKTINFNVGGGSTAVGGGGNGGAVTLSANNLLKPSTANTLSTTGDFSDAVFAESIGGGGGRISGIHKQALGSGTFAAALGLGGTAGTGGSGGAVTVTTGGGITTTGQSSSAVVAQSVGGGGGHALSGFVGNYTTASSIPGTNILLTSGAGAAPTTATATSATATSKGGKVTSVSLLPGSSTTASVSTAGAMALGGNSTLVGNAGVVSVNSGSTITTNAADSDGINAQSIGGGGGRSQLFDFYSNSPFAAGTMTLGGSGSGGGSGNALNVDNRGEINTVGDLSTGIFAQSLGGGGGDARHYSYTALEGLTVGYTMNLGQLAGAANNAVGGAVAVTNGAGIYTDGAGADGILAQSIGGGGGNAALAAGGGSASILSPNTTMGTASALVGTLSGSVSSSGNSAASGLSSGTLSGAQVSNSNGVSYAGVLGANGGIGLNGGNVAITNTNSVRTGMVPSSTTVTAGYGASAIVAQSIGAGGGVLREHGTNVALSQTSVALTLGATAGPSAAPTSGNGGSVEINNNTSSDGYVSTAADAATALLAQSVGGGGGEAILTNTTVGSGGSLAVAVVMGNPSAGNNAGTGGAATVTTGSTIATSGDSAGAIVAQSIGGGGGVAKVSTAAAIAGNVFSLADQIQAVTTSSAQVNNGLGVSATLGSGGSGTAGSSAAGLVSVTNGSQFSTLGYLSPGIVAQSIGGGGGLLDVRSVAPNEGLAALQLQLGGSDSSTGSGVALDSAGGIATYGGGSEGILAQAIAGGGGRVGVLMKNVTSSSNNVGTGDITLGAKNLSLSSTAGAITGANTVSGMTVSGAVTTNDGPWAPAVTGQSIGGGGGIVVKSLNNVTAQFNNITLGMGAGNTVQSHGGAVTTTSSGALTTAGYQSSGLVMQSIGGGGGTVYSDATNATLGSTSGGGNGGVVSLTSTSVINTSGSDSHGIVAQSVGGGGGFLDGTASNSLTLGNVNGGAGTGAAVSVAANGTTGIVTHGTNAAGILAQSVGGGGGIGSYSTAIAIGGNNTASQAGGAVTVANSASIITNGAGAPGILAQSVGGGGGIGLTTQATGTITTNAGNGAGGAVTVNVNAAIQTLGAYADGVIAQSVGGGGGLSLSSVSGVTAKAGGGTGTGGAVAVNLATGVAVSATGTGSKAIAMFNGASVTDPHLTVGSGASVTGGKDGGVGVFIDGGNNRIDNAGTIGTVDGIDGMAIVSGHGTNYVDNTGTLVGSMRFGGDSTLIDNLKGGTILAGTSIDLGNNGKFVNAGTFVPGGGVVGRTTLLTGAFEQQSGGVMQFAMQRDSASTAQLKVNGIATLGGKIELKLADLNPLKTQGSFVHKDVISASGGIVNKGFALLAPQSAIIGNAMTVSGNSVDVTTTLNYSPTGLSKGGARIGDFIGTVQAKGGMPLVDEIMPHIVNTQAVNNLDKTYSRALGDSLTAIPQVSLMTARQSMSTYSQRAERWRAGTLDLTQDKASGAWLTANGGTGHINGDVGKLTANTWGLAAGMDRELSKYLLVGVGVSGGRTSMNDNEGGVSGVLSSGGAGGYGLVRVGKAYVSMSSYFGGDSTPLTRSLFAGSNSDRGNVNFSSLLVGGQFEVGYTMGFKALSITPFTAFAPTGRWQNSTKETVVLANGSVVGVNYAGQSTESLPLSVGVQLGSDIKLHNGGELALDGRIGYTHDFSTDRSLTRSYTAMPSVSLTSNGGYGVADAGFANAGVQYNHPNGVSLFAGVNSQVGSDIATFGGQAGFKVRW